MYRAFSKNRYLMTFDIPYDSDHCGESSATLTRFSMSDQAPPLQKHPHLSPQQQSHNASESTAGVCGRSLQRTGGAAVMCGSPFAAGGGSSSRDGRLTARSSRHQAAPATTCAGQGVQQQQQQLHTQGITGRQAGPYI